DMPAEDFLAVIDSIAPFVEKHKVSIIITGGEPLVRQDLETVGMELYKREFPWGIVSNGLLLTRRRLDSLLAAGMHAITISLDGFEEAHNWLRGHPQSFTRASEAIRMLSGEKELRWDVVTCVNGRNFKDLPRFKEYLIELGVKEWRIFTIFPVGRAAEHPELQLSDADFTALLEFIKQTRQEKTIRLNFACEGFLGGYEAEVRDSFYSCNAGISVASVLVDGSISACPSIRSNFSQGNIYKDNFMDVWENGYQTFRKREWLRSGQCAQCSLFRYCEGNGMHLHDETGKLLVCHYQRIVK
ncbi:MAG: TIGR04133 family radical SAM/SPASM protein, partial [Bacteroides graminisolvens]